MTDKEKYTAPKNCLQRAEAKKKHYARYSRKTRLTTMRYTDKEIELIRNYNYSAAELSRKLGRSAKAIESFRHRLRVKDKEAAIRW